MTEKFDKLLNNLKTDLEWAEANEWESPICLSDDLKEAIELMKALQTLTESFENKFKAIKFANDDEMSTLEDDLIVKMSRTMIMYLMNTSINVIEEKDGTWTTHSGNDILYVNVN